MNAIRCCIACILPCGALDVIRIVHANGRVEELTGSVHAAEVLKAHPKHVLKKPCSTSATIVVVPPDVELQRGKIYFLIPVGPTTSKKKKQHHGHQQGMITASSSPSVTSTSSPSTARRRRRRRGESGRSGSGSGCNKSMSVRANMVFSDQYLSEIMNENEKISRSNSQGERRRGRVPVWRPHLESICEDASSAT